MRSSIASGPCVLLPLVIACLVAGLGGASAQSTETGFLNRSVTVDGSEYAALKAIGADVQYTELPGVGHNSWDPAHDRADLTAWLFAQRRR